MWRKSGDHPYHNITAFGVSILYMGNPRRNVPSSFEGAILLMVRRPPHTIDKIPPVIYLEGNI
jgi:hypothetical protein